MGFKKKHWTGILLVVVSLIIGVVVGTFIPDQPFSRKLFFSNYNKIEDILEIINEDYVDTVKINSLIENAIPHIIDELDPHSSYIPYQGAQMYSEDITGAFGGIGLTIERHDNCDTIVVVRMMAGSPSEQAGLMRGDRIVTVNDTPYIDIKMPFNETVGLLRGVIGTNVKLGVLRQNIDSIIPYSIERKSIPIETIIAAYEVDKGIGLIKIYDKFTHRTYDEFLNALAKLKAAGCTNFIVDLRGNGGGAMDAAINIANEFLPKDRLIVYAEGKSFPQNNIFANGTGTLQNGEVVFLVDQLSASASEIIAGAIQDNDRGLIVGRRTYGKGLIQSHIELADGSALRLTVARYFTPSGRNIQRHYELGKGKEYNREWLDQLTGAESFSKDSIRIDSALLYTTTGGRTVYGGGGIIPDIFVPVDTTALTTYYMNMESQNIFKRFAFYYADTNRDILKEFKTYSELLEYLESEPILWEVVRFAEEKGIRRRSNLIYKSAQHILINTYAHILRNYFGDEAFYPIYMKDDPVVLKAIEVIRQERAYPSNIIRKEYD